MAPAPPLPVTEDTPPDMLAGSMDLRVLLPGGRAVKMSAERCTPMMDLLVQVTTANKMAPGGYVLQPVGERGVLPYKPSTPIGALDTWTIQIVPKVRTISTNSLKKAPLKPNNQQPFEQTFRLQVHLPRNQLFVTRVSPKSLLSDVLNLACSEKNLDPNKYELRHPANLEERLRPEWTLADYKLQEVTLVAKGNRPLGSGLSSSDIMALQKEEEKRRQQVRANGGTGSAVLGLMLGKNSQSSGCEGSISSDSLGGRSISPARSDDTPSPPGSSLPPPRPTRKRRPAPKPPTLAAQEQQPPSAVISHSRNSSDSSGYHEASILSESPESNGLSSPSGTLPRRSKLTNNSAQPTNVATSHNLSRSLSNLTHTSNGQGAVMSSIQKNSHSVSTTSLASSGHGKKKKAAPPPPPVIARSTVPGHLLPEQRTASLSTLSSQSSGDSFDRELYSRSATLERPSSQSSTASNIARPESLPEEITANECEPISEKNELLQNLHMELSREKRPQIIPHEREIEKSISNSPENSAQETHNKEHQNLPPVEDTVQCPEDPLPSHVEEKSVPLLPKPKLRTGNPAVHKYGESSEIAAPVSKQHNCLTATPTQNIVASPRASLPDVVSDLQKDTDEIQKEFESVTKDLQAVILAEETKQVPSIINLPSPKTSSPSVSLVDWEYHLPAPPSAFRDTQSPTFTTETDHLSEVPAFEETTPEVLPPAGFIDEEKSFQENQKNLTNLIIEKECPLIQNLVKEVTKVNPLFNDEQYEAEILESHIHSKKSDTCFVNGNETTDEEDWNPQQLSADTDLNVLSKDHGRTVHCSSASDINNVNQLKNFSISSYQKSYDTDFIFKDDNGTQKTVYEFKKPTETSVYTKNKSSSASNTSNLPRNNSFSAKNTLQIEHFPVKRSTSHVSLNNSGRTFRAKSIGNLTMEISREGCGSQAGENKIHDGHEGLRKTTSEANINQEYGKSSRLAELQDQFLQWQEQLLRQTQPDIPLQSLQVLRSILSPSQEGFRDKAKEKKVFEGFSQNNKYTLTSKSRNVESLEETESSSSHSNDVQLRRQSSSATDSTKRYSYQGPPAVNFSTWSERPKSQVSIKVDNDYRIGKRQNSSTHSITNKGSQHVENDLDMKERKSVDQVDSKVNSSGLTRSESMTQINGHPKVEPTALTMRIISHTTPSGYKKAFPTSGSVTTKSQDLMQNNEKELSSSHHPVTRVQSYNSAQIADPSRVPIVRAVELKKSFVQGQQSGTITEKKPSTTSVKLSWNEMSNQHARNGYANENDDKTEETFQGVNNLAKRFSLAASSSEHIKYSQTVPRPASAYCDSKTRIDVDNKSSNTNVTNIKESNGIASGYSNVKKYTSVVGVNGVSSTTNYKDLPQEVNRLTPKVTITSTTPKVVSTPASKPSGVFNSRHPMPVVKGFRFATNDYSDSSLVAADSYKVPQNSQQSVTVNILQKNSFLNSNQRNSVAESAPSVSVRIQPAPASKPLQVLSQGSSHTPVPPSAPALPKKMLTSKSKSFHTPEVNARDQLMDAIRNFGGRGNLRQNSTS